VVKKVNEDRTEKVWQTWTEFQRALGPVLAKIAIEQKMVETRENTRIDLTKLPADFPEEERYQGPFAFECKNRANHSSKF